MRKIIAYIICLALIVSIVPASPVSALDWKGNVSVTKHDSYNKDGQFFMSFTVHNTLEGYTGAYSLYFVYAKLLNPSGKTVTEWSSQTVPKQESKKINYGYDYSGLDTGKYTLVLDVKYGDFKTDVWQWKYTIDHTKKSSSVTFGDYEKELDKNGKELHIMKLTIKDAKGQKATYKILDSSGNLVYQWVGKEFDTNNWSSSFRWNGWLNNERGANSRQLASGTYTLQVTITGSNKIFEKDYNLRITQEAKG